MHSEFAKRTLNQRFGRGLYDYRFEHDACGVGMVCHLKGEKSHGIIADGLKILVNLTHRGACGCDETTGDGAGILIQMPHRFLASVCAAESIDLAEEHQYGCGLVFLPPDHNQRRFCMENFEKVVGEEGQHFLGWRKVPVDSEALGFTGPEPNTVAKIYGLDLDERGNIKTGSNHMTSVSGVFSAGDAHRGQSLIVWAISEGREAARCVDLYLMGTSELPTKGGGDLPRI